MTAELTLSPKHAGALSEWSRNMLLQESPDVETLLRQMLARNIELTNHRAEIRGGGGNEPKGVLPTPGHQTGKAYTALFEVVEEAGKKTHNKHIDAMRGPTPKHN